MIADGVLERLSVQIAADLDGLTTSVAPLGRAVDRLADDVEKKTSRIGRAFERMGPVVSGFVGGIVAGLGVEAFNALGNFTQKTLETADNIGDLAQRLGMTTTAVQELNGVFIANGASPELMTTAMDKLNQQLGEFTMSGKGPAADAFERLGIASDIASGKIQGSEAVFYAIVEALESVEDPAERARLSMELFGRAAGPDMVEVLSAGSVAMQEQRAEIQRLGLTMDDDLIAKTAEAKLEIDRASYAMGQWAQIGIANVIVGLRELFDQMGNSKQRNSELTFSVDTLKNGLLALVDPTGASRAGLEGLRQAAGNLFDVLRNRVAESTASFSAWVAGVRQWVAEAIAAIAGLPAEFARIGGQMVDGLISGITGGIGRVRAAVTRMADDAVQSARDALGIRSPSREFMAIGEYVMQGFEVGIDNGAPGALNKFQAFSDDLTAILGGLSGRTQTSVAEMIDAFSRLASQALPNIFGSGTKGGGILSTIASIANIFSGRGGSVPSMGKAGSIPGFGGGMQAINQVRVFIGNEAIDNRMVSIASGVAGQAFNASRGQIPIDLARAQRGRIWG